MRERDISLDLMRFIGILVIIIAHTDPPGWLYQLRNFGTPLLIVTSALTHSIIYKRKVFDVRTFLIKRLTRLVFPAWLFLTFFYPVLWITANLMKVEYPFTFKEILLSYPLYSGFVWIFKVYFILALITPFTLNYKRKITNKLLYFTIILLVYFVYEVIYFYSKSYIPPGLRDFLDTVVFVIIPYSAIYIYGFKLEDLSRRTIIYIILGSTAIFVFLAIKYYMINGGFVQPQEYKYPPRIYYLSFTFIAIHIIYLLRDPLKNFFSKSAIVWLSSKSLWIYLWHILAYYLLNFTLGWGSRSLLVSLGCALFLLGFSVLITYLQTYYVDRFLIENKSVFLKRISKYLK
jgi:peptidoglycan/LPS O-acetylase OafA/YrhL